MLTAEQIRAARALVRMDQRQLAEAAGVSVETIKRLEGMAGRLTKVRVDTLDAIHSALADRVEFLDGPYSGDGGPGVRLRRK